MKTCKEIKQILDKNKPKLKKKYKIRSIALFGSYACNDQQTGSDVDILVDVDPSIGLDFVTLTDEIEKLLGLHVDLVSRRAITPRHWKEIEEEVQYV